jgi:tetratricopeptide (TPR) repeat protein
MPGTRRARWSLGLALALVGLPDAATGQAPGPDSLFAAGRLAEARVALEERLRGDPADSVARVRAGLLALWANDLARADSLLGRALVEDPTDRESLEALAESRYRQGRFREAAPLFLRLGRPGRSCPWSRSS